MPRQTHAEKPKTQQRQEPQPEQAAKTPTSELSDDLDSILDEIDAVLEHNAEEFVNSYVQKGGE